jgi:predicted ATPase
LPVKHLHVRGYRSLRDFHIDLDRVNVIVGPNGCGKTNLYRSLFLLYSAANGQFARDLANEGGMPSILWAGRLSKDEEPRFFVEVSFDELSYSLECGRIPISERIDLTCFANDPDIKEEKVEITFAGRKSELMKRVGGLVSARSMDGRKVEYPMSVTSGESILSGLREPHLFPELSSMRQEFLNWRFYHKFRTDAESPLRRPQISVLTPVMAHDGSDVAAAIATIAGTGDKAEFDRLLRLAFPGSSVSVTLREDLLSLKMRMPGYNRSFEAVELSDGTMQYLCLLAALLTPRPPTLMALNEPENSIHPDLFDPLAQTIAHCSKTTQLMVMTHSQELGRLLGKYSNANPIELIKVSGETRVVGSEHEADIEDEADTDDE